MAKNRKRPGRTRTKRDNRRAPMLLSKIDPQDINVREGETKSIVCPDCRTWRRLMGDTKLVIREHCVSDKVAEGEKHVRCDGSNQVIQLDIPIEQWSEAMLAADSTATGRRSARQHYKPLPAPAKPVAKMVPAPTAQAALAAYREHFKKCQASGAQGRCTGTQRCAVGVRLSKIYEQRKVLDRERARFDRRYIAEAAKKTAAEWTKQLEATADAKKLSKRSGTGIEEANNICRIHPADTVSDNRGPQVPTQPVRITA
ncbi:hypothetical protein PV367_07425 [Streptomyces europaeiscabiei]|uniref:Uncharacterized protein n=1 Tax=Streptomyces europaeiscabiei TaxID=146819 RepID=A0AAJ2UK98_9ACTN|nr:hypothetical protein [Streptomyces europaeiscabiei]MDX3129630.1 hypothetical protein [Streptomyces europaeiscabiei]